MISFSIILTSCCSPRYITDPLFLELKQVSPGCPLSACKGDESDCKARPWTSIEYDFGKNTTLKVGQYYHGFSQKKMASIGVNWLHQGKGLNGINADVQIGFFPIKGFFTMFSGLEYSRYNKDPKSQVITPTFSYSIPSKYLNHFQIKTGYNIGLTSQQKAGFYFGINTQIPLAEVLGF